MKVLKFGGSSLADATDICACFEIERRYTPNRQVAAVVLSARKG